MSCLSQNWQPSCWNTQESESRTDERCASGSSPTRLRPSCGQVSDLRLRLGVGKLCSFGVGWSVALMITRRSG